MQVKYILLKPVIVNDVVKSIYDYSYFETPLTSFEVEQIQSLQLDKSTPEAFKPNPSIEALTNIHKTTIFGSIDYIYNSLEYCVNPSLIPENYKDKQIMIAYMHDEFDFNKWLFDQEVECELIDGVLFFQLLKTSSRYMDKYKDLMQKRNLLLDKAIVGLNGYNLDANDKAIHRTTAIIVASLAKILESISQNNPEVASAIKQIDDHYLIKFKDAEDNFIDLKPSELVEAHYKMLTNLQDLYNKYQMIEYKK